MESSDRHALDFLSLPKAVDVRLQRRLDFNPPSSTLVPILPYGRLGKDCFISRRGRMVAW